MTIEKLGTLVLWVLLLPVTTLLTATIGAGFVYFGWNGCHHLLGMRDITFTEAFWLCVLARAVLTVTVTGGNK